MSFKQKMRLEMRKKCIGLLCLVAIFIFADQLKADYDIAEIDNPEAWSMWRTGPIPFPTYMFPDVPETLQAGPPVDLGDKGNDLTVVLPSGLGTDVHERGLEQVAKWYRGRGMKEANISTVPDLTDKLLQRNLILLGTPDSNPLAKKILNEESEELSLEIIAPGGYHIKPTLNPWNKAKAAVLVMGADAEGAWRAATVVCFSIHASMHTGSVGKLHRWPFDLPEGYFWVPFEARYSKQEEDALTTPGFGPKTLEHPRVPYGIRAWGSPTPTLNTFKRMVLALEPFGINAMVIQPGGWQDIRNSGEICGQAIDFAYRAGIFSWLYVGNDLQGHRPAPLTPKHRDMVSSVKDHPGLIGWRLYNQLTADLSPTERQMIKGQIEWLRSLSDKPIGMEIVWGHNTGPIVPNKADLVRDLLEWGVDEIAHDYAPIGGWSKDHDISLWEPRLKSLCQLGIEPFVVLQAHVPFIEPTLPTPSEIRNQFWWCVAGGAKAFFYENAYSFNHFSNRGLLTWLLKPVPDGRLEEIGRLSHIVRKLEEMIETSEFATSEETKRLGIKVAEGEQNYSIRIRRAAENLTYILFINRDLEKDTQVKFYLPDTFHDPVDIVAGETLLRQGRERLYTINLLPGGGTSLRVIPKNIR